MTEPTGPAPAQPPKPAKKRNPRTKTIPEGTQVFNGHPLLQPYPQNLLSPRDPNSTDPVDPIIRMHKNARRCQDTPLGFISVVKLPDGRSLVDAREAIALADGKHHFRGYTPNRTKEAKAEANSIMVKWSRTLTTIPAVYIKFGKAIHAVPFVDDDGFLDIIEMGFGGRTKIEKARQRRFVKAVLAYDLQTLDEIREEMEFENRRQENENQNFVFITCAAFQRRNREQ
ncbi:uncharacterized protein BJ171DRAFT_495760 [Polychytrium aggregatum]|uniref:uncharacterized protein n=1 Tax=Polychytrium aggregatum TaxID=110093 RepID=UPI0022FEDD72|nr:uncharacterized protein BJ171DRAFT_495760 [Polychytrium aggregatum]KAI9206552.1 hypothetical protein BJ171DRAFT_495760 [Polychytrium aggregatum]